MSTNQSPPARLPTKRTFGSLAAAGLVALALSACGSSASSSTQTKATALPTHLLNTKRVALAIEQSILSERRLHSKVTCPTVVPQQKGRSFTCVATTATHKRSVKTVFTVFQKNGQGNVTYASPK
jgi:hypothetical protein